MKNDPAGVKETSSTETTSQSFTPSAEPVSNHNGILLGAYRHTSDTGVLHFGIAHIIMFISTIGP